MLLTPEEAAKTICPLIRHCVNEDAVMQDGRSAIDAHAACQGPGCKIGWRWASSLTINNPSHARGVGQSINKTHGYCGFAGRPD